MKPWAREGKMVAIDAIFNHVTVARLVADYLEDVDIRQISLDPRLNFFDSLPKSYWSKRAKQKYQDCEFERRLATALPLLDVQGKLRKILFFSFKIENLISLENLNKKVEILLS